LGRQEKTKNGKAEGKSKCHWVFAKEKKISGKKSKLKKSNKRRRNREIGLGSCKFCTNNTSPGKGQETNPQSHAVLWGGKENGLKQGRRARKSRTERAACQLRRDHQRKTVTVEKKQKMEGRTKLPPQEGIKTVKAAGKWARRTCLCAMGGPRKNANSHGQKSTGGHPKANIMKG